MEKRYKSAPALEVRKRDTRRVIGERKRVDSRPHSSGTGTPRTSERTRSLNNRNI